MVSSNLKCDVYKISLLSIAQAAGACAGGVVQICSMLDETNALRLAKAYAAVCNHPRFFNSVAFSNRLQNN
jgi:hypothetical protein